MNFGYGMFWFLESDNCTLISESALAGLGDKIAADTVKEGWAWCISGVRFCPTYSAMTAMKPMNGRPMEGRDNLAICPKLLRKVCCGRNVYIYSVPLPKNLAHFCVHPFSGVPSASLIYFSLLVLVIYM